MALRDYLTSRRAEIEKQIKDLKAELAEIRTAEAALLGGSTDGDDASTSGAKIRPGSIKDWVLKELAQWPAMTTEDLILAVKHSGGPDVPRNSMTPQLSRLKSDGLISLEGRLWRLCSTAPIEREMDFS